MTSNNNMLTPEQAGDVINYFHNGETQNALRYGWKEKIPLGSSALHATRWDYDVRPDGKPLLTHNEMTAGLQYLEATHPQTT